MAKKPTPAAAGKTGSMVLAERLRAAAAADPDFAADDLPTETGVLIEAGVMFHVTDAAGRVYRVRVNRRS